MRRMKMILCQWMAVGLAFSCLAPEAFAAVAFKNTNTPYRAGSSPSTHSFSVTAGGSDKVAFACIAFDYHGSEAITSVTYGGQAMTSAGAASDNPSGEFYSQVFYLVNPPTGSNSLVVTASGTMDDIYSNVISFTGVDQANPVRAGTYQNPSNAASSNDANKRYVMTVTSNVQDLTMTCLNTGDQSAFTTSQTDDGSDGTGYAGIGSDHATTAAASVTHTWTTDTKNLPIAIVGFSIQAASASSPSSVLNDSTWYDSYININ